ncbi:MAG: hypothetical protein ACHQIO_02335 [Nevskiales bacterium]
MDVGALFLIGIPLGVAFGILQAAFWLRWRQRELLWWAAADWLGVAGVLLRLSGVSGASIPPWVVQSLAETALFASGLLLWLGMRRFARQSLPLRTFAALAFLYFVAFEALRSFVQDLAALIVLASFAHGLLHAGVALDLARAPLTGRSRVRGFLVAVLVLHALFYLFRSATAVTVEPGAEFLHAVGLQSATLLFGLANVLLWNSAALWMVGERQRDLDPGAAAANA